MRATATGVVANLFRMLPPELLYELGVRRIKLGGNARKEYYKNEIKRFCAGRFDVIDSNHSDVSAAYGAALHALHISKRKAEELTNN